MIATIKGDFSRVDVHGRLIMSTRFANGPVSVGQDLLARDLFGHEELVGRVVKLDGERVVVAVCWDPHLKTSEMQAPRFENCRIVSA